MKYYYVIVIFIELILYIDYAIYTYWFLSQMATIIIFRRDFIVEYSVNSCMINFLFW